jgi:hypothetical protein
VTGGPDRVIPGLRAPVRWDTLAHVLLFLLLGTYPYVLLLTWAIAIYLTWIEVREQGMDWRHKLWWIQLTFLTHFPGYLVLRFWIFYRRRRAAA